MKPIKDILNMLVSEITKCLDKIKFIDESPIYYNEQLGDTSFLLAGLLESLLKEKDKEWKSEKWMDDSLITGIVLQNNAVKINGVIIWGRENTTEQWTDPFSFEIELLENKKSYKEFVFLFCDLDTPEIAYEEFKNDRNYWTRIDRTWKYVIRSNEF